MKLPFNLIRLITVSLSTFLVVGSVTWYAVSISRKFEKRPEQNKQTEQKQEKTEESVNSSELLPLSLQGESQTGPGKPILPLNPIGPATSELPIHPPVESDSSGFSAGLRDALVSKNAIPWKLKPVDQVKHPERFKQPADWQTFDLKESVHLLRSFLKNPNRYYGKFDLQEDLTKWSPTQTRQPDWTTIPWEELCRRYILRYPSEAQKKGVWAGYTMRYPEQVKKYKSPEQMLEKLKQNLSAIQLPKYLQVLDLTHYRLVNLE